MAIQDPQQGIINNQLKPAPQQLVEPAAQPVDQVATPAAPATPVPPDEYKAPTVAPIASAVDAPTETVESRLSDITAKGSRYTDLAKADAIRQANTRGLINTTMAGAAGTEAAIRAALPIAQQDARTYTEARMANQAAENEFLRNRQSASLNIEAAAHTSKLAQIEQTLSSELNTKFETTMQDARFSDEAKIQIVTTMNNIIRDTQEQITQVGLSDRSAAQQVSAINMIQQSRDAELAVYQDLLGSFNDWEWSTDFTPKPTASTTSESVLSPPPTEPPPKLQPFNITYAKDPGYYKSIIDAQVSDDGMWKYENGQWVPNDK